MSSSVQANWTLQTLLSDQARESVPDVAVHGVCLDSRLVTSGDVYLAVDGATTHGMRYALAAVAAGAVAVVTTPGALDDHADIVEQLRAEGTPVVAIDELKQHSAAIASRFYGAPSGQLTIIAVTGTDGKTSVCRFIAQTFSALNRRCGYIGTIGWGLGDSLQPTELTTPDAVTLQKMLAAMRDQGAELVALEASSHALAEGRLDNVAIDVAVLTNLGRDHLDYHQTVEHYQASKARLFRWPSLSAMVVNGSDAMGQQLLSSIDALEQYAFAANADSSTDALRGQSATGAHWIEATDVCATQEGLSFTVREGHAPDVLSGEVKAGLLGSFNVDNLLACYGCLRACQVAANEARHALSSVTPVEGRMERFGGGDGPTVVVDFSHTPQALQVAIAAARHHCTRQLWVVFGCGGDRDPGKRAPMAAAAEAADNIVLTDDNPRTENSQSIINEVMSGFTDPAAVTVIPNRAEAIAHAVAEATAGDLVLIAGKGHEDYQIIGSTKYPFSDRCEVLAALEQAS